MSLPMSVPTIDMSASDGVRRLSRKLIARIGGPLASSTIRGGYGLYCKYKPVPGKMAVDRDKKDAMGGATDSNHSWL
jgi:hypothetical protein